MKTTTDKKKILVVDDESDMRIFISTVLEIKGYQAITAKDGAEALETARRDPPDLVILDVMMPSIQDGVQTYFQFKTDRKLVRIPIIMLSAIAKKTFFHSLKVLCPHKKRDMPEPQAYMEKPPDADELIGMIRTIFGAADIKAE